MLAIILGACFTALVNITAIYADGSSRLFTFRGEHRLTNITSTVPDVDSAILCGSTCLNYNSADSPCVSFSYNVDSKVCELSLHPAVSDGLSNPNVRIFQRSGIPAGYVYNSATDTCYGYFEEPVKWAKARANCRKNGADIASFNSTSDLMWLRERQSLFGGWDGKYTSLMKNRGGEWRWTNSKGSQPLTYTEVWLPGEPANNPSYLCAITSLSSTSALGFTALRCSEDHGYICEKVGCM